MFLVTGGLYQYEMKGSYNVQTHTVTLSEPLKPDLSAALAVADRELKSRDIPLPTGKAGIKKAGSGWELEWTGANRDVVLQPTADPAAAKLVVRDTTWYRRLVQLHKAKGGPAFKAYAAAWAGGLLLLFSSGLVLAWQMPNIRRLAIGALIAGLASFIVLVALG